MKSLESVMEILRSHKDEMRKKFGVCVLGIFGSYVRGEETDESDIDILVDFASEYRTFDNYMDVKFYLEDLLETRVDLIMKTALKPRIRPYVLEEVVYV